MKITEIKRTVSDGQYNNMSATATLGENDDSIESALLLDAKIKKMMAAIDDRMESVSDFRREKADAVSILKDALDHAQKNDMPF